MRLHTKIATLCFVGGGGNSQEVPGEKSVGKDYAQS